MNKFSFKFPAAQVAYVGMDVHQSTISIAVCVERGKSTYLTTIATDHAEVTTFFEMAKTAYEEIHATFEAGGCGFHLHRLLTELNIHNIICAPSKLPKKPGKMIKNDKEDACMLADLLRKHLVFGNDELAEVFVHDLEDEAVREKTRYREAKMQIAKIMKSQILGILRRYGHKFPGKTNWTNPFWRWLHAVKMPTRSIQDVFELYIEDLQRELDHIRLLDTEIAEIRMTWKRGAVVHALMGFRGIDVLTATSIVAEIGEFSRFEKAGKFMKYLGLIPSEYSSSERVTPNKVIAKKVNRGGITKAGNTRVRRLLVEAATHAGKGHKTSAELKRRRKGLPKAVIDHCTKGQQRLHRTYWKLATAGKDLKLVRVAAARELAGFIWAVAKMTETQELSVGNQKTAA